MSSFTPWISDHVHVVPFKGRYNLYKYKSPRKKENAEKWKEHKTSHKESYPLKNSFLSTFVNNLPSPSLHTHTHTEVTLKFLLYLSLHLFPETITINYCCTLHTLLSVLWMYIYTFINIFFFSTKNDGVIRNYFEICLSHWYTLMIFPCQNLLCSFQQLKNVSCYIHQTRLWDVMLYKLTL